jgi:uncharacterized protein
VSSAFEVPVAALLRDVPSRSAVSFSAPFDEKGEFEPRAFGESDVPAGAEATLTMTVASYRGGLDVKGRIAAPWRGICRRCSTTIDGVLEVDVSERFEENLAPEDEEAYPFVGDVIDLSDLVHDAILLELPVAPLCRADCQGLCAICGIDKNEASCECRVEPDARWATLDALRFEDE